MSFVSAHGHPYGNDIKPQHASDYMSKSQKRSHNAKLIHFTTLCNVTITYINSEILTATDVIGAVLQNSSTQEN